jgi:hypothetical protein
MVLLIVELSIHFTKMLLINAEIESDISYITLRKIKYHLAPNYIYIYIISQQKQK